MTKFEEKNNDAERIIAYLKKQFLEAQKAENNLEQQLKKRIQEYERLEEDIMHLRNKLDEESIKSKFEKSSNNLDEILSVQIPSSDKSRFGYDKEKKPGHSSCTNQDGNKRSYAVALKSQIKREESKKYSPLLQISDMMPKRPMASRHQQLFLGNFYTCNNFGHIARNSKLMVPTEKCITPQTSFYKKSGTRRNT